MTPILGDGGPATCTVLVSEDPDRITRAQAALDRSGILYAVVVPLEGWRAVNVRTPDLRAAVDAVRVSQGG